MKCRYQRGNIILVVMIILMISAIFLLNSLHYQLDNALAITGDERRYLQAYNQALSSLSWGLNRIWNVSFSPPRGRFKTSWHCPEQPEKKFNACLKPTYVPGIFLMKGESKALPGKPPMAIYQLVKPEQQIKSIWIINNSKMIAIAGGMLDFCPEKNEGFCIDKH